MKKIKLGKKVVVSDPCYDLGTWCLAIIENVKVGEYLVNVTKMDTKGWGNRVSSIKVVHAENIFSKHNWEKTEHEIGVDSGQAGIFDFPTFRKNNEGWYDSMCDLTDGEPGWGTYNKGVVSRSGFGDGSYDLYISKVDDKIVGMAIDFHVDEDLSFL